MDKKLEVTLECKGTNLKFKANSVVDCLEKLTPKMRKTTSVLTVSAGDKIFRTLLTPLRIKRFLANKTNKAILTKQINRILYV